MSGSGLRIFRELALLTTCRVDKFTIPLRVELFTPLVEKRWQLPQKFDLLLKLGRQRGQHFGPV